MNEQECLSRMVAPGTRRPGKYREGVIQIHVTRACDKSCFNCTQGSNLGGKTGFITAAQFEAAVRSLGFVGHRHPDYGRTNEYFGVIGVFGGNPALHPKFIDLCEILADLVPWEQRGIWCNNPITLDNALAMNRTFNPAVSNLNVHLDRAAYDLFKEGWPQCNPVGLTQDSRHSPVHLAMKDVLRVTCPTCKVRAYTTFFTDPGPCPSCGTPYGEIGRVYDESRAWELISGCDINRHWSAMIGVFRGELRAWFCEVAGAQAMLHQDDPDYPDTGLDPTATYMAEGLRWWQLPVQNFGHQVRKHCHECGVPLRGFGELAQCADVAGLEQTSKTHEGIYRPKRRHRKVQVVEDLVQLGVGRVGQMTRYLQNADLGKGG